MRQANRRHPLVQAHVVSTGQRQLSWVPSEVPFQARWLDGDEALDFAACHAFDLQRETGLRLWVQQRGDEATIYTEFHHTCCDGAGGLAYMEDLFGLYALAVNYGQPDASRLPPINPLKLKGRGRFHLPTFPLSLKLRSAWSDLQHTLCLSLKSATPLATRPGGGPVTAGSQPRFLSRQFDPACYRAVRSHAASVGVSLNDWLIQQLLLTIRDWNRDAGDSDHNWLRLLIPVNLRDRDDMDMSAANRLSYGFISRPGHRVGCDTDSLRSIASDGVWMRRAGLPNRLLQKFAWLHATRAWPLVFSPTRCLATAVFSNLGDPMRRFRLRFPRHGGLTQIGNLLLTSFEGTTALRPMTRAGLFVNTYGNRLTISIRFDPAAFAAEDATIFFDRLQARLGMAPPSLRQRLAA